MAIIGDSPIGLQNNLNLLKTYCEHTKTNDSGHVDVVNDFNYLGTCFNYTGTFLLNQDI